MRDVKWEAVMEAAEWRCQCTGHCGRSHRAGLGRCQRETYSGMVSGLQVAPGDLVDAGGLVALCDSCHGDLARSARARRAQAELEAQDDLFGPGLLAG
ncbi:MAG: hypothetical protein GEV11_18820 [Streptosporangiales bacterium]|nr:hypothetical protein [Streptosporangiales bacterium]